MAQRSSQQGGEGLSLQTLVIAALAAGSAAILTSSFWQKGTLVSAAMTPVIVAVVSEMLKRPAQKVRRATSSARTPTPARERVPLAYGAGAGSPAERPSREMPAPREPAAPMSQYKVYRAESRGPRVGRIHWKIVLATAAAAFVIAVAALTLPELLFGSSVSGSQSTTFFGGTTSTHRATDQQKTTTDKQKTTTDKQRTTPTQTETTPTQTTTAPTQTQTAPTQSTPSPSLAPQQSSPPPASTPDSGQAPSGSGSSPPSDQQQTPSPSG
jgi:hypothetical protein